MGARLQRGGSTDALGSNDPDRLEPQAVHSVAAGHAGRGCRWIHGPQGALGLAVTLGLGHERRQGHMQR